MSEKQQLIGRELDCAIAEALGYTVRKNVDVIDTYYTLYSPSDTLITTTLEGVSPQLVNAEARAWGYVPRFHEDANETLAVCSAKWWRIEFAYYLEASSTTWFAVIHKRGKSIRVGSKVSFQEAAARALLNALQDDGQ